MKFVNIHDAKTNLSKYIEQVTKEHSAIIICRNGVPVGKLMEYKQEKTRQIGILKGKIAMSDDFDDELPNEFWNFNEDLRNPK
jgi:prevent-host-death family protein